MKLPPPDAIVNIYVGLPAERQRGIYKIPASPPEKEKRRP